LSGDAAVTVRASVARIVPLAWPVLVGQVAVLMFATVDTILVARHSAADLAAYAVGGAAYITVFIGLMGVVLAVSPIVGQLFGAQRLQAAGDQLHQTVWLAIGLSALGSTLLLFPAPFLWLAKASPEMAGKVRGYLDALALSLPASLMFTAYRGFNTAVSRPKAVMALQLGGLALKVPLSSALVFGVPALGIPALGVTGCGISTAVAMWTQVLVALWVLRRDPFYTPFALLGRGLDRPQLAALKAQLRLGLPMGASIVIEVTGFAFMAIFIARLGTTAVAGHQLAANLVSLMFMMPLALANATGTLVAQQLGAQDSPGAERLAWHGLVIGCAVAAVMALALLAGRHGVLGLYTRDGAVLAAALPLLAWLAVFHVADAAQTVAVFVLRAYHIALVPVLIYVAALWGVGLGGGWLLAFDRSGMVPAAWRGAPGYWVAATAGLLIAAVALVVFMGWVLRQSRPRQPPAASAAHPAPG
jgi:multidrug resistance protein, MATE family